MSNERKDDAASGGDEASDGTGARAHANGAGHLPGSGLLTPAVCRELADILESVGAELEGLGRTFAETGRLLRSVDGDSAAAAIGGVRIEIRAIRDLLTHADVNLPGR
jgi:hypothetical protein